MQPRPSADIAHAAPRALLISAFGAFLVMGIAGAMATTLVPLVPQLFGLGLAAAMIVQWIALLVSGGSSLLLAHRLQRAGPRSVMLGGLALVMAGCVLVALAISPPLPFAALVAALALVALGIAALQVAANLCALNAGPSRTAASRLAAAQACNSVGVLGGVSLGAWLGLGSGSRGAGLAYLVAALITGGVLAATLLVRTEAWGEGRADGASAPIRQAPIRQALRSRTAWIGAVTIALYVGAEGTTGSLLIPYLHQPSSLNLDLAAAGQLVAWVYWGGALAGRAAGSAVLARVRPAGLLVAAALLGLTCSLAATLGSGTLPGWGLLATGLFNAVMFPVIFALTVEHADAPPAAVSGLLSTAIAGGALLSAVAGYLAEHQGIAAAFTVPAFAYGAVAAFGFWALRRPTKPPQDSRTTSSIESRSDLTS